MIETTYRTDWTTLKRRLQELRPELQDDALPPAGTLPEEVVWHLQRRLTLPVEEAHALFERANQPENSPTSCPPQ